MLEAKLVVVGGDLPEREFVLKLPTVIGRGREADIVIAHPLVSRRHCELLEEDGELMVRDLASLNGTFVGREQVYHQAVLPGELLTVGTITFRAIYNNWSEDRPETHVTMGSGIPDGDGLHADDTCNLQADPTTIHRDDATKPAEPHLSTGSQPR